MCNDKLVKDCGHVRTNIDIVVGEIRTYLREQPDEKIIHMSLVDLTQDTGTEGRFQQIARCPHCYQAFIDEIAIPLWDRKILVPHG